MSTEIHTEITAKLLSLDDTHRLAKVLAEVLKAGDIMIMGGDLGSGKTTFVKALVAALGSDNDVTSPTYAIANFYELPTAQFLHIDAYRLGSVEEFHDLGLFAFFDDCITAIEWGERVRDDFEDYLEMRLEMVGENFEERAVHFSRSGKKWERKFADLFTKIDTYNGESNG